MSISIVIPNYNGEKLLLKNLPKLFAVLASYKDIEVIVVDDYSEDNSLNVLKQFDLKVLSNEKNLGFSSTINRGVKEARSDIVFLLNTDVYPEKDFLKPLLAHFEDNTIFAVGCLDKSMESGQVVKRGRGLGEWKRGFLIHRRGEVNKKNTLWVSCGSGAFRKSIWDKLGGLNELYNPFYWEDIDISYRAQKSGYKVLFEAGSEVVHEHEKGAINSKYSSSEIKAIAYRNQFIFVWSNADAYNLLSHLLWLPYHFLKALLRLDKQFFTGLLNAILLITKIALSRHKSKKLFVKKDSQVIEELN